MMQYWLLLITPNVEKNPTINVFLKNKSNLACGLNVNAV